MAATIASVAQSTVSSLATVIGRALPRLFAAAMLLMALSLGQQASAADVSPGAHPWVVSQLRGAAFARPADAGDAQWETLQIGAQIAPGSRVRTDAAGSLELANGMDTIRLSPSSELELPAPRDGDPVTRVIHWIGTAFFHVGKRPGPQFEVDTPYIVAIVKGTKFTTSVSDAGAKVEVSEGVVGVSAAAGGPSIDVTAGGSASVSADHSDTVTPGPSGDADPAGQDDGSTRAQAGTDTETSDETDVEAGTVSSADGTLGGGSTIGRGGRGRGNGNGRGRDESEGSNAVIGNGSGQGGVDDGGDDDDDGGDDDDGEGEGNGCHGHGNRHHDGGHHGGHTH
jgi:hypothetical protein